MTDSTRVRIERDDLSGEAVRALVAEHLEDMYATSPPESVHALGLDALVGPGMSLWSAWRGEELLGFAALKALDERHAEIKSMRTTRAARGSGVGARLLAHLLEQARAAGYARLSLETGSEPYFAAARRLYLRHGFAQCEPFADYVPDPNSVFLTRVV